MFPHPGLGSAEEREPDEAADLQLAAAILQAKLAFVDGAIVRIEDVAARVLIVVRLHVSHEDQADEGLVFAIVLALRADPVGVGCGEVPLDPGEEFSLLLVYLDDASGAARLVVDGPPGADRRIQAALVRQGGECGEGEGEGVKGGAKWLFHGGEVIPSGAGED